MRTVDPEIWSRKLKKPRIQVTRVNKFGQQPAQKYERIFRESFVDAALEFWTNCSVPVVRYINMDDISKQERYCYIVLMLVTLGMAVFMVSHNCYTFYVTPPLVVSVKSSETLMTDVSFPAVAFCSNGVISKIAMDNLIEPFYKHPKNQARPVPFNRSEIQSFFYDVGALLMLTVPDVKLTFGKFLTEIDPYLNVTDVMYRLAPPCTSVLNRCSWRGERMPCESLFGARLTPLGFCCVFNSRYYPVDANNKARSLNLTGQNYGLGVVLAENRDDHLYLRRNVYGAEMLIFEGSEYPLLESGDVRLYPIPRNVSLFVNIKILMQKVNADVNYYSEHWRGCRTYGPGQSWCLTNCRRETSVALCGCIPYVLTAGHHNDTRRVCALRDSPCLNKHREKFMYLFPSSAVDDPHLSEEVQDGLLCEQCLVLCRRQMYSATISYSHFTKKTDLFGNLLTKGLQFLNTSTIRLFYSSEQHDHFSLEAYLRWYEVVVKLSTQWTIVAGVSALAVVELVYHWIYRWPHHFVRRLRLANLHRTTPST